MEAGRKLGPYEILEPLGKGGMGEVYLAQDSRLGRKVAIKVLPEQFAGDPERLARFAQEARAAAALNHPHIAAVHDVGHEDGVHFMVQEHLEGRTLRAAMAEGRLPLNKGLALAIEIAEGLGAAHAEGIVHRDLKPDNVFVTPDGHAKILDFGLAKLTEMAPVSGDGSATMSPTVLGTVAGQMMGTAGYMAPEQVEGVNVDHRADIFAFGCVLYELTAGQQAFRGKNLVDTLHQVSNVAPDGLVTIDGSLPAQLQRVLDKALAKDPSARYQTAGDLAVDLRSLAGAIAAGETTPVALAGVAAGGGTPRVVVAGIALAAAVVSALGVWLLTPVESAPTAVVYFDFDMLVDDGFTNPGSRPLSISPDGHRIAFGDEGLVRLRDLSEPGLKEVRGTTSPRTPIFSPDGEWIAFYAGDELRKVPAVGGAPMKLAGVGLPRGMSWTGDGFILVAVRGEGIVRVPEEGGEPEMLVPEQEGESFQGPSLLPGGDWILFSRFDREAATTWSDAQVVAQSLRTAERRVLVPGGVEPRYVDSGHITFVRSGSLVAVPFDAAAVEVTGGAVPLIEGLRMASGGGAYYDISANGDLVLFTGRGGSQESQRLAWYDADGSLEVLPFEPTDIGRHDIAPDGNRVAVGLRSDGDASDIWIYELDRLASQRLTPAGLLAEDPIWSPDGEWVYFTNRSEGGTISRIRADFSGAVEQVAQGKALGAARDISPDGTSLLLEIRTDGYDMGLVDLETGAIEEVLMTPGETEAFAQFSPEGRFVAYLLIEGGDRGVYVRDLESGRRYVVSTDRGRNPRWSPDGETLYYLRDASLMRVAVTYEPSLRFGTPVPMFEMPALTTFPRDQFVISPAGDRFLIVTDVSRAQGEDRSGRGKIEVLLNWGQVLRDRVRSR